MKRSSARLTLGYLAIVFGFLGFVLDRTDGHYDSEIVLVSFKDGSLTMSEYLPD